MLNLSPAIVISRMITLVIAFTIHEFSHAWVAYQFGDDTAARAGRLTLNPIAHLDVLGTLLLLVVGFGWAKPTPVNPYAVNRKSKYGMTLVSLAGPVSNLLLAGLAAIPFRLNLVQYTGMNSTLFPSMGEFLIEFILINITLLLFNLLPIAPLDGENILSSLLPPGPAQFMDRIRPYGSMILLGLVMLGQFGSINVLGAILNPPMTVIFRLLLGA
jgi:Zn-dependent protease